MNIGVGIWGLSTHSRYKIMPSLDKIPNMKFIGFLSRPNSKNHALTKKNYIFNSQEEFLNNTKLDLIIISTPPALHFQNAKAALLAGKNVVVEKPLTIDFDNTNELIQIAKSKNLLLIESYYYQYHSHFEQIKNDFSKIKYEPSYIVCRFGIPFLERDSFRDNKQLGASSFWDVGCYPISLISELFEEIELNVNYKNFKITKTSKIDFKGTVILGSDHGHEIILQWNMGFAYQNSIEIWHRKFYMKSNFIFSKPDDIDIIISYKDMIGKSRKDYVKNINSIDLFFKLLIKNIKSKKFKTSALKKIEKTALLQDKILK